MRIVKLIVWHADDSTDGGTGSGESVGEALLLSPEEARTMLGIRHRDEPGVRSEDDGELCASSRNDLLRLVNHVILDQQAMRASRPGHDVFSSAADAAPTTEAATRHDVQDSQPGSRGRLLRHPSAKHSDAVEESPIAH